MRDWNENIIIDFKVGCLSVLKVFNGWVRHSLNTPWHYDAYEYVSQPDVIYVFDNSQCLYSRTALDIVQLVIHSYTLHYTTLYHINIIAMFNLNFQLELYQMLAYSEQCSRFYDCTHYLCLSNHFQIKSLALALFVCVDSLFTKMGLFYYFAAIVYYFMFPFTHLATIDHLLRYQNSCQNHLFSCFDVQFKICRTVCKQHH